MTDAFLTGPTENTQLLMVVLTPEKEQTNDRKLTGCTERKKFFLETSKLIITQKYQPVFPQRL